MKTWTIKPENNHHLICNMRPWRGTFPSTFTLTTYKLGKHFRLRSSVPSYNPLPAEIYRTYPAQPLSSIPTNNQQTHNDTPTTKLHWNLNPNTSSLKSQFLLVNMVLTTFGIAFLSPHQASLAPCLMHLNCFITELDVARVAYRENCVIWDRRVTFGTNYQRIWYCLLSVYFWKHFF